MFDNSDMGELLVDASKHIKLRAEILDESGEILVSSDPKRIGLTDEFFENLEFSSDMIKSGENNATYLKFGTPSGNCFISIEGIGKNTSDYAYLLAGAALQIVKASQQGKSKNDVYKRLIYGGIDKPELQEAAARFKIKIDTPVCLILIQADEDKADSIYSILSKIFRPSGGDNVVLLSKRMAAIIKAIDGENDMDTIIELAEAIDETLETEVQCIASIGIGGVKNSLYSLRDSYLEAQDAIDLGTLQESGRRIYVFQRLLLERFLQEIPKNLRKQFYDLAYSDLLQNIMTDELLVTINAFFECNLNLSEAARKIYIHRNTLIYRLDKVQKLTGLDLRNFDDAALLKIMLMLGNSLSKEGGSYRKL